MLVYEHIEHPSRKGPVEVMFVEDELNQKYPHLSQYAAPLKAAERAIIGREALEDSIRSTLERPELCNVLLRGDAGSGKTAGVQLTMLNDPARLYLEVDPAKLVANLANPNEMASRLKTLFDEAEVFVATEKRELVLFIDEFHQIVQLSDAAVEALKPVLAASGVRGIRVIAATTNEEFHQFIAPNLPLMERFEIVIVEPPSNEVCVQILRGMAERYGVGDKFYNDHLFRNIVEYTNRYITASAQPRKSIKVLDAMVGRHNYTHKPMDRDMLADVLYRSTGINVVFNVDPRSIEKRLNERVYSQKAACDLLTRRLNICVADLHDKSRPRSSFLFVGSTGVGKTELTKALSDILFGDGVGMSHFIRFDMAEYSKPGDAASLQSRLTRAVWENPFSVVLLDEIEKADESCIQLLLAMLDDGRMTDDNGRQVSFLQCYFVLTTNAGASIFKTISQYAEDNEGSGEKLEDFRGQIRRGLLDDGFRPELLGRIDETIPFQPLSRETREKIVKRKMATLVREVKIKHNMELTIGPRVLTYLIEDKSNTQSDAGGARDDISRFNKEVIAEVAQFVNYNPQVRSVLVDIEGEMVSENSSIRKGTAHVVVREHLGSTLIRA